MNGGRIRRLESVDCTGNIILTEFIAHPRKSIILHGADEFLALGWRAELFKGDIFPAKQGNDIFVEVRTECRLINTGSDHTIHHACVGVEIIIILCQLVLCQLVVCVEAVFVQVGDSLRVCDRHVRLEITDIHTELDGLETEHRVTGRLTCERWVLCDSAFGRVNGCLILDHRIKHRLVELAQKRGIFLGGHPLLRLLKQGSLSGSGGSLLRNSVTRVLWLDEQFGRFLGGNVGRRICAGLVDFGELRGVRCGSSRFNLRALGIGVAVRADDIGGRGDRRNHRGHHGRNDRRCNDRRYYWGGGNYGRCNHSRTARPLSGTRRGSRPRLRICGLESRNRSSGSSTRLHLSLTRSNSSRIRRRSGLTARCIPFSECGISGRGDPAKHWG